MNTTLQTLFGLAGGLAMFLFGMNMMSEGLQKAAGDKMKRILAILTQNPIFGVLAGAMVTAVLQSSSATTVMVIGFVSADLMSLPQAISVIMGANIGTTMTAQLMAFKISDYIWLIVFIGFMLSFVAKNEKIKNIGQTIFAFGVLFVGIETMGSVMKPLANSPVFLNMIDKVSDIPVLGLLVGMVMTLVVQSSSATIAVLQNFASQPGPDGVSSVLGLAGAIPILLGDNIGTTITALLASVGQSKNAKRTAVAHSVFNITGSIVFMCIIPLFVKFVQWISPKGPEIEVISRQIANAHTSFNVVCTILWLPFIGILVKIVTFLVRGEDRARTGKSKYLDYNILNQPVFAIRMVTQEIEDMVQLVHGVLTDMRKNLSEHSEKGFMEMKEKCDILSRRNDEIVKYLANLFSLGSLTERQTLYVSDMLIILDHLEHIIAQCRELNSCCNEIVEKKLQFSEDAESDIRREIENVMRMYEKIISFLQGKQENPLEEFNKEKEKLVIARNTARKNNVKRMQKNMCQKESGAVFNRILFALERVTHDCFNMLENNVTQFKGNID